MSNKVKLRRQRNLVEIHPCESVLPILEREFVFRRLVDRTDSFGRRIGRKQGPPEKLYELPSDDRAVIPAGLFYRLKLRLDAAGIKYTYEDLRAKKWPEPDYESIFRHGHRLRSGQEEVVAKIATYDMGRFQNPTGDGKSFLVTMAVLLYPKASILIVTAGLSAFESLYRRLLKITPDVGRVGGGRLDVQRITLCNKDSLHRVPREDYDFCFVDECHTMATGRVSEKFGRICNARMFGFSATQTGRGDNSDLLTEAMFGPIIHEVPYGQSYGRGNISQIEVTMYVCPHGPDTSAMQQDVVRKRHAYWRNDYRNEMIARIAREAVSENEQQLIIVDTIEHALRLYKLLPEWTPVYRPGDLAKMQRFIDSGLISRKEMLTREKLRRIEIDFESGRLLRVIANSVWHKAMDFPKLEYLIRADGGYSEIASIQIAGRLSRLHDDNVKHLVDFDDVFDTICRNRSAGRKRHYAKQGWPIHRCMLAPGQEACSAKAT